MSILLKLQVMAAKKTTSPSTPANIAKSMRQAADSHKKRQTDIANHLNTKPEGYQIKQQRHTWTKQIVAGDHFWTNGKKFLSSRQLLEEVGSKPLEPHVPKKLLWG